MAAALLMSAVAAQAALKTQVVEYKQGDTALEGYLAYDDAQQGKRPGVLVVDEWGGLVAYGKHRADMLAQLGYVAFAADIYGKGVRPTTPQAKGQEVGKYMKDRNLLRARAIAGLDQLRNNPMVDASRIGAIGFCFGGTTVLELARSGANVAGVVGFHAGLSNPAPADANNIKAKVLILHGADDPLVNRAQVDAFEKEMDATKADWQVVLYSHTMHSFSNPASNDPAHGIQYNPDTDRRSWQAMRDFFNEIFMK
jgi:dienelactone hydrolase